jgi:hypothetical protein
LCDPDLHKIVTKWRSLPDAIRQAVMLLVASSQSQH